VRLAEAYRLIAELTARAGRLAEQAERLSARVEELERQARRDSATSSRPPSSDSPYRKKGADRSLRERGKRRPGKQPGDPRAGCRVTDRHGHIRQSHSGCQEGETEATENDCPGNGCTIHIEGSGTVTPDNCTRCRAHYAVGLLPATRSDRRPGKGRSELLDVHHVWHVGLAEAQHGERPACPGVPTAAERHHLKGDMGAGSRPRRCPG
jgi:hypothetical protein